MNDFSINEEVLIAYLKGETDDTTAAAVETWYDASEANRKRLGEIYYLLYINDRINDTADIRVERALTQVKNRLSATRRNLIYRRFSRIAVAAMIAIALFSGAWVTISLSNRIALPMTVLTQLGERSQIVLPDGTKVWLNSCSQVEYTSSLFSRERCVKMTGEAYFEVTHDKKAPFIVQVNGLNVKVLGTRFNIRSDAERHSVTTVLLEGAVMAYADNNRSSSVRLRPAQRLFYDTQTGAMQLTDDASAQKSISWIEGRFSFEHNTLEEIVAELERYYNVDVRFMDNTLRSERFSGEFQIKDGIYHIMSVLQLTYKFNYKIAGNTIEVYANTPNN